MNTDTTKLVIVKAGRGTKTHAKECDVTEGRRGFFSNHTACGQQGSSRTALSLHRDNASREDAASVSCEKCAAKFQ